MFDSFDWILVLFAVVIFIFLVLEIWVIILICGFLASWFGFSGLLWWICAIMLFCIINGIIGVVL